MAKLTAQERHEKAVKARKAVETMGDSNTEDEKPVEKPASTSSLSSASPLASPVNKKPQRGTFIVLEGLDRCGKSTQTKCIVDALKKEGTEAMALRFPGQSRLALPPCCMRHTSELMHFPQTARHLSAR